MSESTMSFKEGDTVYLEDGRVAVYYQPLGAHHLVQYIFEYHHDQLEPGDCGYGLSNVETYAEEKLTPVSKVYPKPPTPKIYDENIELTKKNEALRTEQKELVRANLDIKQQMKEFEETIKKHKLLQQAVAFLENRITHVVRDYRSSLVTVLPWAEALKGTKHDYYGPRLLALLGKTTDKPSRFALNEYSDGSGGYVTIYPCESEEEAIAKAAEILENLFQEWLATPDENRRVFDTQRLIESYGESEVPKELTDYMNKKSRVEVDLKISKLEEELAKLRSK